MASTRIIKSTTEVNKSGGGVPFDGFTNISDLQTARIRRMVLTFDSYIRSIAVHYGNDPGPTWGVVVSTECEIILVDGEFITSVNGSTRPNAISHLTFVTNKGSQWGPYGLPNPSTEFDWGGWGPNMGLLSFRGRVDQYFDSLQATYAEYPSSRLPPTLLRYEKQVNSSLEDPQQDGLCTFAQNLMSPTVILAAGPEAKEIHASHGILCQLPFFRAALEGEFREATENRIRMPDNELQSVAALVEFLYTGHYTYSFHTKETEPGIPAADVAEGSFHVFVYTTANKYGCQQLVDASLASFLNVLSQLKGIDVIRLWVIAYDQGLVLDAVAGGSSESPVLQGLGQLLKGLYKTDREEMDSTTVDHPTLIGDFLRHVVSSLD